ncbi:unnamed protein product, partial [Staurois parvus]
MSCQSAPASHHKVQIKVQWDVTQIRNYCVFLLPCNILHELPNLSFSLSLPFV